MNCKITEKIFEQYMNGELDFETETEIERHISGCPECAALYAGFVKMKKGLSSVEDEPLPAQFHNTWTAKLQGISQPQTAGQSKFFKFMPALAAGIAAVAIVSAAFLSGVLNPAPSAMSLTQRDAVSAQDSIAGGAGQQPQDEAARRENAAAAEEGSLFMAQLAPEEEAAQAPEADAAPKEAADTASDTIEPLQIFVTRDTFNSMIIAFDEKQIEYTLDGENIFVSVDDANQEAIASVFKENELELCAVSGGIFEFSISE